MTRPELHLPPSFAAWPAPFLAGFSRRTRPTVAALAVGALLAIGPRTVAACLRVLGLAEHPGFAAFRRVLNRDAWSSVALARVLLRMAVTALVPVGPVVAGVDHTLERRRGRHIGPAGHFYDAGRSSTEWRATSRGLRWLTAAVLVEVPFAGQIWALPVLTALTPGRAWSERHGRRHRPVTDWARRLPPVLRRWLPDRPIVAVMDGEFAALELLHTLRPRTTVITRLRRDARLFDPPSGRDRRGRPFRGEGGRQPSLVVRATDPATRRRRVAQAGRAAWRSAGWVEYAHGTALRHHPGKPVVPILWVLVRYPDGRREPEAFLCTGTEASPRAVLDLFGRRRSMETTHEEARAHLGVETQRQWSDPAVFRTTPPLLGLYSLAALHAHQHAGRLALSPRRAAWYPKPAATFADALARLRRHLWFEHLVTSAGEADMTEPVPPEVRRLIEAACYAP